MNTVCQIRTYYYIKNVTNFLIIEIRLKKIFLLICKESKQEVKKLDYSVKSVQAQQIYRVQPVTLEEKSNRRNFKQQELSGINPFSGKSYSPAYPSVENSPTLAKSLDLLG